MRLSFLKALWGVVLVGLLGGCSTLRLAYDNGPTLAWWWLDGYADFSGEQAARVKDDLRSWFAWHRRAQLEAYAAWLEQPQARMGESVTPAQLCLWVDQARQLLEPALERALHSAAPWVAGLSEAQLQHIAQRYAKGNDELRRQHLQPDPVQRQVAALQRVVDRAELVYGRLDETQRRDLAQALATSPLDPGPWLAERERRQQHTLQTLRGLQAARADGARTVQGLRALVAAAERSPDPTYRAQQQRVRDFHCALAARVHNGTNAVQRQAARAQLQAWRDDLRRLAAEAPA